MAPRRLDTGLMPNQQKRFERLDAKVQAGEDLNRRQQSRYNTLLGRQNPVRGFEGDPNYSKRQLGQQAQQLEGGYNDMLGGVQDYAQNTYANPFQFTGPAMPGADDPNMQAYSQKVVDQTYQNYLRQAEPEFQRQQQSLEQEMANKGIPISSEIYQRELDNLRKQQEGAKQNIRTDSLQLGQNVAESQFGMGERAHNTSYGEQLGEYGLPMQTMQGLMGLGNQAADRRLGIQQQNIQQRQFGQGLGEQKRQADMAQGRYVDPRILADQQLANQRALLAFQYGNDPRFRTPSMGSQIGAGLLGVGGSFLGGLGEAYGQRMGEQGKSIWEGLGGLFGF